MLTTAALDILLVDDDDPLREMLSRSFEREGHKVTAVADGQSALDAAAERPYDIVLLDVALGAGPTGHDVARMLRSRRDVVPIIMLTALDSRGRRRPGARVGRRRLRHQAVRARRAAQPDPRRPAPRAGPRRRGQPDRSAPSPSTATCAA